MHADYLRDRSGQERGHQYRDRQGLLRSHPARPGDILTSARTYYDSATTWSQAPALTRALPTRVDALTGWNAGAGTYARILSTVYDERGRVTSTQDAVHPAETTTYTPALAGPVTSITATDANTKQTSTTLDTSRGLPVSVKDPNNRVTTTRYDALGRLTALWLRTAPPPPAPTRRSPTPSGPPRHPHG